ADEVTRALTGLMYFNDHQFAKAREAVQEGVEGRRLPALIIATYCDLVLKKRAQAQEEAKQALNLAPDPPEVVLLQAYTLSDAIDARRALLHALERNPTMAEGYVLRGFQILLSRGAKRFATADATFEFALKRDPKNLYALMGNAVSLMAQRRPNEAEPILNQLKEMDPNA